MSPSLELPSNQYGFWLPVYSDSKEEYRIVKKIVLRKFKALIWEFRMADYNLIRVKNFTLVERESDSSGPFDQIECGIRTIGWKANIVKASVS